MFGIRSPDGLGLSLVTPRPLALVGLLATPPPPWGLTTLCTGIGWVTLVTLPDGRNPDLLITPSEVLGACIGLLLNPIPEVGLLSIPFPLLGLCWSLPKPVPVIVRGGSLPKPVPVFGRGGSLPNPDPVLGRGGL